MRFTSFDCEAFLRDYWQKKPLLIRDPWQEWVAPLDPDALMELACEDGVEARLVMTSGDGLAVEHGPFPRERFASLGATAWSLLVQGVDTHGDEVAALLEPFRFIPNWRIDDVMASYASDGGGVGAHFDRYDVFLVQGSGRRRWQIGAVCDAGTSLLPHDELRLIADFQPVEEWILEPGDILYLPPGVAHHGVAVGNDCMTYSVGFRSPTRSELMSHWCDHALECMVQDDSYADPALEMQDNPGEIAPAALTALHAMALEQLLDRDAFARWFGRYNTSAKDPEIDWSPANPLAAADVCSGLEARLSVSRNPAVRWSFIRTETGLVLFVNGEYFDCTGAAAAFAQDICARECVSFETGTKPDKDLADLVLSLCNAGYCAFDDPA